MILNNIKKVIRFIERHPLLTAICTSGTIIAYIWEESRKIFFNIILKLERILEYNIPIIYFIIITIIFTLIIRRNNNKFKLVNENKVNYDDNFYLEDPIENYKKDVFENLTFSWDYEKIGNGHNITNLNIICPVCKEKVLECEEISEIDYDAGKYNRGISLTCFDCYIVTDEDGNYSTNDKARILYDEKEYISLEKLVKSLIIIRVLKSKLKEVENKDSLGA